MFAASNPSYVYSAARGGHSLHTSNTILTVFTRFLREWGPSRASRTVIACDLPLSCIHPLPPQPSALPAICFHKSLSSK